MGNTPSHTNPTPPSNPPVPPIKSPTPHLKNRSSKPPSEPVGPNQPQLDTSPALTNNKPCSALPLSMTSEYTAQRDVSMTDVNAPIRRTSTLILTDDLEFERLKLALQQAAQTAQLAPSAPSGDVPMADAHGPAKVSARPDTGNPPFAGAAPTAGEVPPVEAAPAVAPTEIKWTQGGTKVYVTGSFTGWRKMIGLVQTSESTFAIKLALPAGTHRFRFVVDNELRFSDFLPTATDQMGNFVNYIEVTAPQPEPSALPLSVDMRQKMRSADSKLGLTQDADDMGNGYSRYHDESHVQLAPVRDYTHRIPAIFTDPKVMEQYYLTLDQQQRGAQQQWLIPPQLPPHLENVILNSYSGNDLGSAGVQNISGALPIPNHVVLNHLATTSIKHNTLAVASIVRYKQKYSTQILYAPLQ